MDRLGIDEGAKDKRRQKAIDTIIIPDRGQTAHVVVDGDFDFEDVVAVVSGGVPDRLDLSCWAIGVETSERLSKTVRSLRVILDPRIYRLAQRPSVDILQSADVPIAFHANHAKFAIIEANGRTWLITSSANPNRNHRIEQYTIITDHGTIAMFQESFDSIMDGGDPFKAGNLRRKSS